MDISGPRWWIPGSGAGAGGGGGGSSSRWDPSKGTSYLRRDQFGTPAAREDITPWDAESKFLEQERQRAYIDMLRARTAGMGSGAQGIDPTQARDIADPFWQQRGAYQQQLSDLLKNPGDFASSPMYQFAFDQGMQGVNRTAAAKGQLSSGNRLADLTKFGQGLASQQFFPMANLLGKLAGVDASNPAAALSGIVTARGQDINARTAQDQIDAQLMLGQGNNALDRDKFNYQVGQDAASEAAGRRAVSDYNWQQAYKNLHSGYSFG